MLPKVKRPSSCKDSKSRDNLVSQSESCRLAESMAIKPHIVVKCVVNNIIHIIANYGGQGNCLFLAASGRFRDVNPASVETHFSLRKQVLDWYKENGEEYRG